MGDDVFLNALQKTTAGLLTLPDLVAAATLLCQQGQTREAQQLYAVWTRFKADDPQLFVALFNHASLLTQIGEIQAATDALSRAITQNPDFLPAYINLGGLLEKSGSVDAAMGQWKTVIDRLAPVTASAVRYKIAALKHMGRVFSEHRQSALAEAAMRECLSLDPSQRDVAGQLVGLRLLQCEWPVVQPWDGVERAALMNGIMPLSVNSYTDDPLLQLACASRYVDQTTTLCTPSEVDRRHAAIEPGRRLRIGYLSSDLRDHAVGYLMVEAFELHDKAAVEVFAYYSGTPSTDPVGGRIRAAAEHWVDIRTLSDDEAAARIAEDGIDILVDVNGHTRDSRTGVFARRPAPIQVNWLGYPGSMGSAFHQYLIADPWIIPTEHERYYSERVLRLPCYQPSDRKRVVAAERPTRRDAGLPDDALVYCSFNGSQKLSRFTFDRWMEILRRVPDSVLWLIESEAATHARLRGHAEAAGIDPGRLVFAPKQHNALHLARYPLADLFLDTVPYGAHTTASDALWMGVPVLTLSGRSFASRVCGSLVRAAGLPELVCTTPEEYVERAVALGTNRSALAAQRVRLQFAKHSCVLFDMEGLVARLEGLYRTMAEEHRAGRTPTPDLVNLEAYLAVGLAFEHEATEMLAVDDYDGLYREQLSRRHALRPLQTDSRLWTARDIAAADGRDPPESLAFSPAGARVVGL